MKKFKYFNKNFTYLQAGWQPSLMDKKKYLERIKYTGFIEVADDVLIGLHKQHVYQIPFENLDVYYKRIFNLDLASIYQKIITNERGGFCYELNLLFNWLLKEVGFFSRIIAARIFNEQGTPGPKFDHMAVYVKTKKEFLVDVGYGDLFVSPIEIKIGIQWDGWNYFQIDRLNDHEYLLSMSPDGLNYKKRYIFSLNVVKEEDFNSICLDKQTNPNSYFVKNVVCTKPTQTGRTTIFNNKLIEKNGESRFETLIQDDDNLKRHLKEKFGIVIK